MDFMFELIAEIVLEGIFELGKSRRVPMPVRVIALVLSVSLFISVIVLLVILTVCLAHKGYFIPSALTAVLSAVFIFSAIRSVIKYIYTDRP